MSKNCFLGKKLKFIRDDDDNRKAIVNLHKLKRIKLQFKAKSTFWSWTLKEIK
jgi:hypothetical protein